MFLARFGERAIAQRCFLTNPANSVNVVSHCRIGTAAMQTDLTLGSS